MVDSILFGVGSVVFAGAVGFALYVWIQQENLKREWTVLEAERDAIEAWRNDMLAYQAQLIANSPESNPEAGGTSET